MKILSSSPYATFNAKEWCSVTDSNRSISSSASAKISKRYYKDNKIVEFKKVINANQEDPKMIQLSIV